MTGERGSNEAPFRDVGQDVHELIEMAEQGDKYALFELYGRASAWARGGTSPIPEPLGTWVADRLLQVAQAIHARRDADIGRERGMERGGGRQIEAELAVALKVRRAGAKGRPRKGKTEDGEVCLARQVLHFIEREALQPSEAMRRAIAYNEAKRIPTASDKAFEAAWRKHGKRLLRESGIELPPQS